MEYRVREADGTERWRLDTGLVKLSGDGCTAPGTTMASGRSPHFECGTTADELNAMLLKTFAKGRSCPMIMCSSTSCPSRALGKLLKTALRERYSRRQAEQN
jgi:hypothetical protein